MGILDGIVEWLATQIMNLLDLLSTSVLGALWEGRADAVFRAYDKFIPAALPGVPDDAGRTSHVIRQVQHRFQALRVRQHLRLRVRRKRREISAFHVT